MKYAAIASVLIAAVLAGCRPYPPPEGQSAGYDRPLGSPVMAELPPPPPRGTHPMLVAPTVPAAPGGGTRTVTVPLPPPPPRAQPLPVQVHVVQFGQTVWKISGMYYGRSTQANVARIVAANPGMDADRIQIGQRIIIPE